jgi:rhodanese-related sulfurtransferase
MKHVRASRLPLIGLCAGALAVACGETEAGPRPHGTAPAEKPAAGATAALDPDTVAAALEAELARYPERYAHEPFPLVSVADVEALLQRGADVVVIDARDPVSYARGHLPGAVSIPFGNWLEEGKPLPPQDRDLIVYCNNLDCPISRLWSEQAVQRGYTRVRHMKAGLAGWQEAGLPVEKGAPGSQP